jgi:hypothetical protein
MKMSGENRTGLAKAAAISASILIVSLGLCGMNLLTAKGLNTSGKFFPVFMVTGVLELIGIFVGLAGLLIVGLLALIRTLRPGTGQSGEE